MNIEQLSKLFREDVFINQYNFILEKHTGSLSVVIYSYSSFIPTPKDLVLVEYGVTNFVGGSKPIYIHEITYKLSETFLKEFFK